MSFCYNTFYDNAPPRPDPQAILSRYMDPMKFAHLLSTKILVMPRVVLLDDDHEGSIPKGISDKEPADTRRKLSWLRRKLREASYVSCWHLGEDESVAMWRSYCPARDGVAIQTTCSTLRSYVKDHYTYISTVEYSDYGKESFSVQNMHYPFLHKRKAFAFENEVRILKVILEDVDKLAEDNNESFRIIWDDEEYKIIDVSDATTAHYKILAEASSATWQRHTAGISIDINPSHLIKRILVHPDAPEWHLKIIQDIVAKFCPTLTDKVTMSKLCEIPNY